MMRSRFVGMLGAGALALMVLAQAAHADVRVVVGFKSTPAKSLLQNENAQIHREVTNLKFVAATVPAAAIARLRADPRVAYVEQDTVFSASRGKPVKEEPESPTPTQVVPWGVGRVWWGQMVEEPTGTFSFPSNHGANEKMGLLPDSRTVKVAIIDTGIDLNHPDLNVIANGGVNYVNRKKPDDDHGHGTHVAGIVGAIDNDLGVVGVAPNVQLYAVKVLDRRGSGYMSDVAAGIDWAAANDMDVANMSLGGSAGWTLGVAVALAAPTVLLVAASGNNGNGVIDNRDAEKSYPAAWPSCLAVGSTARRDQVSNFSNTGDQLDMAAPGYAILSTYRGGTYATMSGTSMASPHVAGLAALLISWGGVYSGTETPTDPEDPEFSTNYDLLDTGLWSQMQSLADPGLTDIHEWAFGEGIASFTTD